MLHDKPYSGRIFANVIDAYMDSGKFRNLAHHSKRNYRRVLMLAARLDGLGSTPVEDMRPALVQAFLDGFDDRPSAQQKAKDVIVQVEKFAVVRDLLPRPITTGCEAPGGDGGHLPWADELVAYAEHTAAPWIAKAITLAANTGQRGSDLITMCWTDIKDVNGHPGIKVIQQKTKLRIWIPFTRALVAAMATWQRAPGPILRKADDHPFYNRQQLTDAWIREKRRKEMELLDGYVMHGLRGTAVVRLRRAGCTLPEITSMVGMSEQMVRRYCRFSDQEQNALAAVVRLDGTKVENPREQSATRDGDSSVLSMHRSSGELASKPLK